MRAFQKYEAGEVAPAAAMQRLLYICDKFPQVLGALGIAVATNKFTERGEDATEAVAQN